MVFKRVQSVLSPVPVFGLFCPFTVWGSSAEDLGLVGRGLSEGEVGKREGKLEKSAEK